MSDARATGVPPAPWRLRAGAVAWFGPPDERLRAELPRGAVPVLAIGALVEYAETPVGPYLEVLGMVLARRGPRVLAHVPFMAVDSERSVAGGRANWALPKVLASFDGDTARGEGFEISARAEARGPALPFVAPPLVALVQHAAGGGELSARPSARGWARAATVEVEVRGDAAAWLPAGRRPGVVAPRISARLGRASAFGT